MTDALFNTLYQLRRLFKVYWR